MAARRRHGHRGCGDPLAGAWRMDDDPAEAFRCYEATRIPRVGEVQRISVENSWMRGPTETDWFFCYDACRRPWRSRPEADRRGKTMSKPTTSRRGPDPMIARDSSATASSRPNPPGRAARGSPSTSISTSRAAAELSLANGDAVSGGQLNDIGVPTSAAPRAAGGVRVRVRQSARCLARARYLQRALRPVSVLGVVRALEQNPELAQGLRRARTRDRQPRLSLDRLRAVPEDGRARAHAARRSRV